MSDKSFSNDYLLEQGIVLMAGEIDTAMSQLIVAELQYLDNKYPGRPIQLWINSPGGEVSSGFAIYDCMNYINSEVQTIAIGMAASMAAFLLSSGTKGKRCSLPNSEIMIHQPLGGVRGQAADIILAAKNLEQTRSRLNYIMARNTGHTQQEIERDTDRDNSMTAQQALEYGLIDQIIETTPKAWASNFDS